MSKTGNGKLIAEGRDFFLVRCAGCDANEWSAGEINRRQSFVSYLRQLGWSGKGGKWRCPQCIKEKP